METSATGSATKRKERDAAAPAAGPSDPAGGNMLLAGLLAHEFLSSGTVLGERRRAGPGPGPATGGGASRYEAVAVLVQRGAARVPGVVNPAQLAAWAGM
ncbi:hypothetical protein BS78_01G207700 [Paspalum vaginatum]|nr:hypothetical protein BS78_01G207700 [Paspalum vaginatum]